VSQNRPVLFRGRHFEDVIIILSVRWYLRYFAELSGFGGDHCGARAIDRPRHDLALGPTLCTHFESAASPRVAATKWLVEGGRPILRSPGGGLTSIGQSIPPVTPSISCCHPSGI